MTKEKLEKLTKKELQTVYPKAGLKSSMLKSEMINTALDFENNKKKPEKKAIKSMANEY